MVNESVGSIRVYVEFLSPGEISEDIEVNVTITTINGTAFGNAIEHTYTYIHYSKTAWGCDTLIVLYLSFRW